MRLRPRALFLPVCIAILLAAAAAVPLPLFVERPGAVVSLADLVDVGATPDEGSGEIDGDFLLTFVNLRRATLVLAVHGLASSDVSLLPVAQLTGGTDDDAYFRRQREVFATMADVAAALGLQAAGLPVEIGAPSGALVAAVFPGSPAAEALRPGDVVTAVGETPVRSAGDLVAAVRGARADTLEVVFERAGEEQRVRITRGRVPGLPDPGLGVRAEDVVPPIDLPVPVDVDVGRIGGPSAGLMIALTVYDLASPEDLAAGRRVAGTGGVVLDGRVTTIGGIGLKVLAAARQGADVFLAPEAQEDEARSAVPDGSALEVVGVADVDEAIEALQAARSARGETGREGAHPRLATLGGPPWSAPGG